MHLRLCFWVQKLLSTVDLFHKLLQQSIPSNFLWDWGLESMLGGQVVLFFCSSKYFFVIDALWIAAASYWKVHSSPHRWHPPWARDKSFSIFPLSVVFCWSLTNYSLSFPEDEKAPPDHKKSSSSMPCWVILFWKNICMPVLLKAIWTV